jgi:hypothetical protein
VDRGFSRRPVIQLLSGHEDQFRPSSLSGRCRLGEATFAGMGGKEEDAPKADIRRGSTAAI